MTHLIDKAAVIAEIERRKYQFVSQAEAFHGIGKEDKESYFAALASNMNSLLSFLDTIEVKEMNEEPVSNDLEREIKHYVYDPYFDLNGVAVKGATDYLTVEDVADIARHFAQWQKEKLIDKACEWLKEHKEHPLIGCEDPCLSGYLTDEFIEDFKKAMEE